MRNQLQANGRRWAALALAAVILSAPMPAAGQNPAPLKFTAQPGSIQAGRTRDVKITTDGGADLTGFEVQAPPDDTGVQFEKSPAPQLTDTNTAIVVRVKVDQGADPQTLPLRLVKRQNGNVTASHTVELSVTEFRPQTIKKQATPPGLKPEEAVDYMMQPLSYKATKDVYGTRVADAYVAVVIGLGNNTGFDLQITKVGFVTPKVIEVSELDRDGNVVKRKEFLHVAAVDRTLVRGSVEKEQSFGKRALAMNLIAGTGMLTTGFLPFFHALGPRANFSTFSSILNGQLKEGFNTAVPDMTIRHLNRLENNLVMHEEFILPNNSERTTVVFVPRAALDFERYDANKVLAAEGWKGERKTWKRDLDDLTLIRERLGKLTIVGRFVERFANREIVVRTGAAGGVAERPAEGGDRPAPAADAPSPFATTAPAPTVQVVNPNTGTTAGGTTVTIVGANFTGATSVTIGGAQAADVKVINANTISATTPPRASAGSVDVVVTTAAGGASQPFANGFVYAAPPAPAPTPAPAPAPTPAPAPAANPAPSPTPE